jgi:hypothetical protein
MTRTMMNRLLMGVGVAAFMAGPGWAQEGHTTEMRAAMARLDFMVGEWEGSSATRMGPGPAAQAVGREVVRWRLGGLALLVEGEFHASDAPSGAEPVHQALGVITYDLGVGRYRFEAHTAAGQSTASEATLVEGVFEWRLRTPRGWIRYRLSLDEQGRWRETGEASSDGERWLPFFEMTLTRVGR